MYRSNHDTRSNVCVFYFSPGLLLAIDVSVFNENLIGGIMYNKAVGRLLAQENFPTRAVRGKGSISPLRRLICLAGSLICPPPPPPSIFHSSYGPDGRDFLLNIALEECEGFLLRAQSYLPLKTFF